MVAGAFSLGDVRRNRELPAVGFVISLFRFRLSTVLLVVPLIAITSAILRHRNTRQPTIVRDRKTLPYVEPTIPAEFTGDYSYPSTRPVPPWRRLMARRRTEDNHLGGFEWCLKCFDQNAVYKTASPFGKARTNWSRGSYRPRI